MKKSWKSLKIRAIAGGYQYGKTGTYKIAPPIRTTTTPIEIKFDAFGRFPHRLSVALVAFTQKGTR